MSARGECMAAVRRGEALEGADRLVAAAAEYEKALQAWPQCVEALLLLGRAMRTRAASEDDLAAAEAMLRSAVTTATEFAQKQRKARSGRPNGTAAAAAVADPWLLTAECDEQIACGDEAGAALLVLLCQEGRDDEAAPMMRAAGFTHRLSPHVFNYSMPQSGPWRNDIDFVSAVDKALPPHMLRHMQTNFAQDAPFWREHNYSPLTPYYSYLHPLHPAKPSSSLDQIISYLHSIAVALFPAAKDARYAEWWAHCRPHPHGHQLHFDSDDEGRARAGGKPRHPIVSSVLYLTQDVGGPTLVTDQRLGEPLAEHGWFVFPTVNRFTVFDGSVLHGVIPGKGVCRDPDERRITFMVAFWQDIAARPDPNEAPGSSRPFPARKGSRYTWHHQFDPQPDFDQAHPDVDHLLVAKPAPLESVWDEVAASTGKRKQHDDDSDSSDAAPSSSKKRTLPPYSACFQF